MSFDNDFKPNANQPNMIKTLSREVPASHMNISPIEEDVVMETTYDRSVF
jgi:hypothetical protein